MKKIEIYNYDSNETFAIFDTRKKDVQRDVINYLEKNNYSLFLQGTIRPDNSDLYWLARNRITKEHCKLWYREIEKEKELIELEEEMEK